MFRVIASRLFGVRSVAQALVLLFAAAPGLVFAESAANSLQAKAELVGAAAGGAAQGEAITAHQTVERTTRDLVALIEEAQGYIDDDEPRFYQELGNLLEDYVDFKSFSRAVMGKYASKKRMASLDDAEAARLQVQVERFSETFTSALINTYGKGLLVFQGERIEVVPPDADKPVKPGRATVKQLIYGDRETPYEIYYSLRLNSDGEWKIRNMILETTNLGKIYRNQFDNAYKVYEGDIDRVIENWVSG